MRLERYNDVTPTNKLLLIMEFNDKYEFYETLETELKIATYHLNLTSINSIPYCSNFSVTISNKCT